MVLEHISEMIARVITEILVRPARFGGPPKTWPAQEVLPYGPS